MTGRDLAARLGARIVERRGGIEPYRFVVSEADSRGKRIVLYRDTLELLAKIVIARALPFDPDRLDEIAIVHECCHLQRPHASEAVAHRYARRLLRLAASPALLDDALASHARGAPS